MSMKSRRHCSAPLGLTCRVLNSSVRSSEGPQTHWDPTLFPYTLTLPGTLEGWPGGKTDQSNAVRMFSVVMLTGICLLFTV